MNVILSAAFLSRRQALFSAVDIEIVFKYKTEILILRKAWNILPWLLLKMSHRNVFYSSLNTVLGFSWMEGLYLKKIIYYESRDVKSLKVIFPSMTTLRSMSLSNLLIKY